MLSHEVSAYTGWSYRTLLEKFIEDKFKPVLDTKGQSTRFEMTSTGEIEGVKTRSEDKGHVISVLRGFGTTNQMRSMLRKMGLKFTYPKPVNLIAYLIEIFTSEGDVILDSFAGSGTTGHAILQLNRKKGGKRKFILVELNSDTVENVLYPRLCNVIDGHEAAGLEPHGGGFRYYSLANSLLQEDKYGNWIISKDYSPRCWPKPCASIWASPMRQAGTRMNTGITAIRPRPISSSSQRRI